MKTIYFVCKFFFNHFIAYQNMFYAKYDFFSFAKKKGIKNPFSSLKYQRGTH